jgi:hypothetical protein
MPGLRRPADERIEPGQGFDIRDQVVQRLVPDFQRACIVVGTADSIHRAEADPLNSELAGQGDQRIDVGTGVPGLGGQGSVHFGA